MSATFTLLIEVWDDPDEPGLMFWAVSEQADRVLRAVHPRAEILRSFRAQSFADAKQQHYAAQGLPYYLEHPSDDEPFSENQHLEQEAYLARRTAIGT